MRLYSTYNNNDKVILENRFVENSTRSQVDSNPQQVLLVGDSFARPLYTYLCEEFAEVRSLDPQQGRYNDSIREYVSEYQPDVVIIMYSYGYQEEVLDEILQTRSDYNVKNELSAILFAGCQHKF